MAQRDGGKRLVIVESPAKARTLSRYLGRGYDVAASVGHVKDLPQKELGVDVDGGFEPEYRRIRGKGKVLKELRKKARDADEVILATDPDREGEAIAYHVAQELGGPDDGDRFRRVTFHEITRSAVADALETPGPIDMRKVEAQQARRILDRLVGYQASPFLWKPIRPGLSAGRVQTVALRLICEREEEIRAFDPEEYWSIHAFLEKDGEEVEARLHKIDGKKFRLGDERSARGVLDDVDGVAFEITSLKRRERRKNPRPPFTTSTLQQEASKRLGFSSKFTMAVAQRLYEGVQVGKDETGGLITYMRTDSTRVAKPAVEAARSWIRRVAGEEYLPGKPRLWTGTQQKGAQEAHEAIRPTRPELHPDRARRHLGDEQAKLYELIWLRFIASQMAPAVYDTTTADFEIGGETGRRYLFRATGSILKFDGFTRIYREARETGDRRTLDDLEALPELEEGEALPVDRIEPEQHFTNPPPRFSEASLVKELEKRGIGRPSTYAHIISTLRDREYVEVERKRFRATALGETVSKLLVRVFPEIFNVDFTSRMEEELDKVEEGILAWRKVLEDFYGPFRRRLEEGEARSREIVKELLSAGDEDCPECGRSLVVRWNRYGRFLGCSGFPECRYTRSMDDDDLPDLEDEACPECGGALAVRRGRYGPFVACTNYPDCRYTRPVEEEGGAAAPKDTGATCGECGSPMVVKRGRYGPFLACTAYPECENTRPVTIAGIVCPECGEGKIGEKRTRKGKPFWGCVRYPECEWSSWDEPLVTDCPECGFGFLLQKRTKKKGEHLRCPECDAEFEPGEIAATAGDAAAEG